MSVSLRAESSNTKPGERGSRGRKMASQKQRGRNKPGSEAVKEPELHPHRSVFQLRSHASELTGATAKQKISGLAQAQD